MAQDFRLFGFGDENTHISTVDAEGVALAAIQGLNQIVGEQDDRPGHFLLGTPQAAAERGTN